MKKLWSVVFLAIAVYGIVVFLSEGIIIPDFKLLVLLSTLTIINYIMRGFRWQLLLKHFGMHISFSEAVKTYFAGLFFVLTPAKSGEILKGELMKERHGFSKKKIVFITLVERAFDMAAHLILAILGAFFVATTYLKDLFLIAIIGALGIIALYIFRNKLNFIKEELEQLHDIPLILKSITISVAAWIIEATELLILAKWLGTQISIFESFFVFSGSSIFGNIAMLPGGLGAAEAGMISLLVLFGINKTIASTMTIVIRLTTLWLGFALGTIYWHVLYKKNVNTLK